MATAIFMFERAAEAAGLACECTDDRRESGIIPRAVDVRQQTHTVLVVDDDPSIRGLIVAALRRDGYSFFEAPNGREALEVMRTEHPDVVVLDLMMPIVSGWDVLRERQSDPALLRIPVIVVSANREPALASAIDAGICAFLPKPFDIGALSALVRSCMPAA
jgi:CheY-like chemotaxis protein